MRSQTTDRLSGEGDGPEGEETPPGSDGDGGGETTQDWTEAPKSLSGDLASQINIARGCIHDVCIGAGCGVYQQEVETRGRGSNH